LFTVATIFGTRPDALKMAPVITDLRRFPHQVRLRVLVTGQHQEMLHQVLSLFQITPDVDLQIMAARQSLSQIAARVLDRLDPLLAAERPDVVLVQGDTSTSCLASLAAFYHQIPVGHIEAGLRTDNRYDPFPEEINRRLTGVLADFHFAPTAQAAANLAREGVAQERIYQVGNTVIDALLSVAQQPYQFREPALIAAVAGRGPLLLVTAHRRENWGEPLHRIARAVRRLVAEFPSAQVVFQMHKNPIVREAVQAELAGVERVALVEPQEYLPWVQLMKASTLILTDSGGIQEEAPALGKPVLVMRETTERPEGVAAGTARLVGTAEAAIFAAASRLLRDEAEYAAMAQAANPYGDGHAAERIRQILFRHFGVEAGSEAAGLDLGALPPLALAQR
jgi:UDP-N-acetylglucosamine 2-epimerase (non-hydrolysing)